MSAIPTIPTNILSMIGAIPVPFPMFAAETLSGVTTPAPLVPTIGDCDHCVPGPDKDYMGSWTCPHHSDTARKDCEKIRTVSENLKEFSPMVLAGMREDCNTSRASTDELKGFHPAAFIEMRHVLRQALDEIISASSTDQQ